MIANLIEVGSRVSYHEVDDFDARKGTGVIVSTIGLVPPVCPVDLVLYYIKNDEGDHVNMWHTEIMGVLK